MAGSEINCEIIDKTVYLAPKGEYKLFSSSSEALSYGKSIGVFPAKFESPGKVIYKPSYIDNSIPQLAELVGVTDKQISIIKVNGNLHCINPDFLAEMQYDASYFLELFQTALGNDCANLFKISLLPSSSLLMDDIFSGVPFKNINFKPNPSRYPNSSCKLTLCKYADGSLYFPDRGSDGLIPLVGVAQIDFPKIREFSLHQLQSFINLCDGDGV